MIVLELTEEKASMLSEILDMATKSGGIQAAKTTVIIMADLINAVKRHNEEVEKQQAQLPVENEGSNENLPE